MELKDREDNVPFSLLSNEIAELRDIFKDRVDRMALTLKQAEQGKENLTGKIHELEETIKERERLIRVRAAEVGELRTNLDVLTNKVTQKETLLKEVEAVAAREMQQSKELKENLTAKIHDLEDRAREKDKTLEVRATEVRELRSKLDLVANEMTQTESRLKEAAASATREAQEAKSAKESLMTKLNQLELQVREQQELLENRDAELKGVRAKTQALMNRITRMESLFKEAEALVFSESTEGTEASGLSPGRQRDEKAEQSQPVSQPTASVTEPPPAARESPETVPPFFFDLMVRLLTEAMGPMAALVVRDQIAALGESSDAFPKERLQVLVDGVSQEVLDKTLRLRFRQQIAEEIKGSPGVKEAGSETQLQPKRTVPPRSEPVAKNPHESLASNIQSLENQLKEREGLLKVRETELQNLKSKTASKVDGGVAHVEKPGPSQAEVNSLIQAKEEEIRKLNERMSADMDRLRAELKQKKIRLAEMERKEWRAKGLRAFWKKSFGS